MTLCPRESSNLRCYTSEQFYVVWKRVKPLIEKALRRGSNYTIEQIFQGLRTKEMVLWVWQSDGCKPEIYAALITTIQEKEGTKFCLFLALGGSKLKEWIEYLPIVEDWARENGCTEMRIYGRIGWARHIGYDIDYTRMSRQL